MVSAISFKSTQTNGYISPDNNIKGEKVVIMERKPDSFVRKSVKSVAYIKKAYNTVKESVKGIVSAVTTGLVAGGAVMGLDWIIQRASGRGIKEQSAILTPLKTVGNIIWGASKKFIKAFSKDVPTKTVLAYPFIGFPRDVYRYVKSAKGGSKAGKAIAVIIGAGAAALSVCKTLININRLNADVDHGFKVGHNK